MRKYLLMFALGCLMACRSDRTTLSNNDGKEIPSSPNESEEKINKPKRVRIDAHANLNRFATGDTVTSYLEKIKGTSSSETYLDVKPGIGHAPYDGDILAPLTKQGDEIVNCGFDYLGLWLEETECLDIDVIIAISTMGYSYTKGKEGSIHEGNRWDGKTQVMLPEDNDPTQLVDTRDQEDVGVAMLSLCLPEVQELVISIIEEIVIKYPKLKGVSLDYCRWYGGNYGSSDVTIRVFETCSSKSMTDKNDIVTASEGIRTLYEDWIKFCSMCIINLITNIRSKVKTTNPGTEIQLWVSADWEPRYSVGQNWVSRKYIPDLGTRYTEKYDETGFVNQLDIFVLGVYAEVVWIKDDPNSVRSVENFVNIYDDCIEGDCKVYDSIRSYQYNGIGLSDAIYLCMERTGGLMIFGISRVTNNSSWADIKEAIKRIGE